MSNNIKNKVTLANEVKRSPFLLATVGGTIALIADLVWVVSEILLSLHISTEFIHLVVRFGISISLTIAIILCVIACVNYMRNGYARADSKVVLETKKERIQQRKRNIIFKGE